MASKVEICNLALSHLGAKEIASLTERSEESRACNRYYDISLESTLRDFAWSFSQRRVVLGLVESFVLTTSEWNYSYRYPSSCIKIRRILSGNRNDNRQSRVSYEILSDSTGKLIYTDEENAEIEYTHLVTDTSTYPPDFQLALSFRLASYIAPRIAKGDPFGLRKSAMDMYDIELARAKMSDRNEVQKDEIPNSELQRSRE